MLVFAVVMASLVFVVMVVVMALFFVSVMVVMVATAMGNHLGFAFFFVASLTACLNFHRYVSDSVFFEFFLYLFLDLVGIKIRYNVKGSVVVLTVGAPNMKVVDVNDPINR